MSIPYTLILITASGLLFDWYLSKRTAKRIFLCAIDAHCRALEHLKELRLHEAQLALQDAERLVRLCPADKAKFLTVSQECLRQLIDWHEIDRKLGIKL